MPEIEAHAERLGEQFAGRILTRFHPFNFTALKTAVPPPDLAYGLPLLGVRRRGKYLLLEFEPITFVVHLMQGGRLLPDTKLSAKPRGGQARFVFEPVEDRRRHSRRHRAAAHRAGQGTTRRCLVRRQPGGRVDAARRQARPRGRRDHRRDARRAIRRASRCGSTGSSAISGWWPASGAGSPTRSAGPRGCHRSPRPSRSAQRARARSPLRSRTCVADGLDEERARGRHELVEGADECCPQPDRRGVPAAPTSTDPTPSGQSSTPATRSTTARPARPAARSSPTTRRPSS